MLGGPGGYVQVFGPQGPIRAPGDDVALPVDDRTRRAAQGSSGEYYSDAEVAGTHVRILTTPAGNGYVVQIARPLTEVDDSLDQLRTILILVTLGGIGLAAALGLAVSRTALAPVRRLTEATEEVTATRDLSRRMADEGTDELGRLAGSFNTMLAALEDSARSQRRFVADASHELRTPLTSLRTNIEVLARADAMPADERERLLADVVEQLAEMSELVAELVALDKAQEDPAAREDIRLDLLAAEAVERARRNRVEVTFKTNLERDGRQRDTGLHRAGDRQPARQRRQVEPARAERSTWAYAPARSSSATTGRASTRAISRTSSIASTALPRLEVTPARDSASPSFARWPRATAAR